MKMKKLIIITSPLYVRNYIETDAFKAVVDENTFIACSRDITDKNSIKSYGQFSGECGVSAVNELLFGFITKLMMYSNRGINKGFFFYFKIRNPTIYFQSLRLKRKVDIWCSNKLFNYLIIRLLEIIRPFLHPKTLFVYCLIVVIDFLGLTNSVVKRYKSILPINKELKRIIDKVKPDLVLIPNGGLDSLSNDVIFLSNQKHKFKTMLLIDNWDNLCSKSRFAINPDYLCVWGPQAEEHAKIFHEFDTSNIFLAGTPRYDVYYEYQANKKKLEGKYAKTLDFPYILFAGCWPPFDEISVLEQLNGLVEKYKHLLPVDCKILYRPHPWGENYDKLDYLKSKGLVNIEIDPQMSKKSRPDDYTKRTDFQPELDYYPFLLDNSEFVICPLSSILIEASIMDKKILALAHDDGKSLLNPLMLYNNSDYFDRLSDMENINLLHDLNDLDKEIHQIIISDMAVNLNSLSYYIVDDEYSYSDRLANILMQLPIN